MDIRKIFMPLIRWWWLLLAAAVLAGGASYYVTSQRPPVYQTRTTLLVGQSIFDPNPTGNEFFLSQQLASIYADITNREQIREAVKESLGVSRLPNYNARALPNSQFIEIIVTDTNPERAQIVANEFALQLVEQSPSDPSGTSDRTAFVNEQLDYLEVKIGETQTEIQERQVDLAEAVSAQEISDHQQAIAALQNKLNTLQSNYSSLLASTQSGATNTISIIEPAARPTQPVGPNTNILVFLASAVGMMIAGAAAYFLEYMDDTLRTPQDVARVLDSPVIAYLGYSRDVKRSRDEGIYITDHPYSKFAESIRSLRANLEFASAEEDLRTILVTSPGPDEGKTTVAANLAATIAQVGKDVLLIDGDLRRPRIHEMLEVPNEPGFSDLVQGKSVIGDVAKIWNPAGITVIPSGEHVNRPSELLSSDSLFDVMAWVKQTSDVAIFDSSPFMVPDPWPLAAKVDGVIIVVDAGVSREEAALTMRAQLKRLGANVIGVVMNRVRFDSPTGVGYSGYQNYGWFHTNGSSENGRESRGSQAVQRIIQRLRTGEPEESDDE